MPAHITHELFAEEVFAGTLTSSQLEELNQYRAYWVFGAQGPDFFLHNHRTQPSGLIFGQLLHNQGYGTFVSRMIEYANRSESGIGTPIGAFILGFATHAILDRRTHPFINYFTGWVEREAPESIRYTNCHAFFERIIDVLLLRIRKGIHITKYDFVSRIDLGETLPGSLENLLIESIESTYHEYRNHRSIATRIQNAYTDTMNFYRFTNPPERKNLAYAWHRDEGGIDPARRLIALFHPDQLPELDYLNLKRRTWNHPGEISDQHNDSFIDLYEQGIADSAQPIRMVADALSDNTLPELIHTIIGNSNLSDRNERKLRRDLSIVKPLPLDEILASVYAYIKDSISA